MRPLLVAALALFSLPCPASAEGRYLDREGILGALRGPAQAAFWTEINRKSRDCSDWNGKVGKCSFLDNGIGADTTYGQTPSGKRLVFVSVRWKPNPTGSLVKNQGLVFLETSRWVYRLVAERPIRGESISAVQFLDGRVNIVSEGSPSANSRSNPDVSWLDDITYEDPYATAHEAKGN